MSEQPPKRRCQLILRIGADSREDLRAALEQIQFDLDRGLGAHFCTGGYSVGWSGEFSEDPEMTHERYVAELNKYLEASKEPER